MGRIGCNIGEPDNDLGYGDEVVRYVFPVVVDDTDARPVRSAADLGGARKRYYKAFLKNVQPCKHPPVPRGVWR